MRHPGKVSAPSKYLTTEIGLVLTGHLGEDAIVMPDKPAPRSLMTRARNGDTRARCVVVERCAPIIWSFCRWYGPSRQDTDDIGPSARPRLAALIDALRELAAPPDTLAARHTTSAPGSSALPQTSRQRMLIRPETGPDDLPAPAGTGSSSQNVTPCCARPSPSNHRGVDNWPQILRSPALISARLQQSQRAVSGPYRRGCLNAVRRGPPLAAAVSGETRTL